MPHNVVRRASAKSHRKSSDGHRSDSGCFDDVDVLQMNSRQSPVNNMSTDSDEVTSESPPVSESESSTISELPPEARLSPDDGVDDSEFRAIVERLAEVTKNPGDLYRLCFSSRLSFTPSFNGDDETLPPQRTEQPYQLEPTEQDNPGNENACPEEGVAASVASDVQGVKKHDNCGNRDQCVELLSIFSSFMEKANKNPAVFNQSGLGKSLMAHFSSLLSTLETAKNDPNASSSRSQQNIQPSTNEMTTNQTTTENIQQSVTFIEHSEQTATTFVDDTELLPETLLSRRPDDESDEEPIEHYFPETPTENLPVFENVTQRMSLSSASAPALPRISVVHNDHVIHQDADAGDESGDVISNGRRAVKPYSWDYGDIWEKELQRAQSTESFPLEEGTARGELMPSFEEIRDDLFHKAGFTRSKRRSRSADARSNLNDDPHWLVAFPGEQVSANSPFVRTVYQQQGHATNPGLTRSRSTHLDGDITINVHKSQGRRVFSNHPQFDDSWALIVKDAVAETSTFRGPKPWATVKRRPSGLRRRTNSSSRSDSFRSTESNEFNDSPRVRLNSHGESESSDSSFYVSTTSSDCLTTDDSSSITSSPGAASSVQSSPPISNRNSACFSDCGPPELNDLRRVIFQNPTPESYPGGKYPVIKYPGQYSGRSLSRMDRWDMTLDQRFTCMNRNNTVFKAPTHQKVTVSNVHDGNFRGSDPNKERKNPSNILQKYSGKEATALAVRSDSDLNTLTRVQFVGDSYSRSHVSKNLRQARRRSPSPGTHATHTRVVSCEIVQSDRDNKDVYTKVNLSREEYDEGTTSDEHPTLERTRRSWHGHLPQRGFTRQMRTNQNAAPRRSNSERTTCPSGLVDRRRQAFGPHHCEEETLHAKLVEIKNIREHNSCRSGHLHSSSESNFTRHCSNSTNSKCANNGRRYHNCRNGDSRQAAKKYTTIRNNFGRAQALFEKLPNTGSSPGRRLNPNDQTAMDKNSKPSLMTSPFRSNFSKKDRKSGTHRHETSSQIAKLSRSTQGKNAERNSQLRSSSGASKDPVIVKETSFVGAATFTKYQTSTQSKPVQRSRSCNEKDSIAKIRNGHHRRHALTSGQRGDVGPGLPYEPHIRSDSNIGLRHPSQRRRRHSDGASESLGDDQGHLVAPSYCDSHRESIQEGSYSIMSAESARTGVKSAKDAVRSGSGEVKSGRDVSSEKEEVMSGNEGEMIIRIEGRNEIIKIPDVVVTQAPENIVGLPELKRKQQGFVIKRMSDRGETSFRDSLEILNDPQVTEDREEDDDEKDTGNYDSIVDDVSETSNGVSICIDYRNKKPVSVEYRDDEEKENRVEDLTKPSEVGVSDDHPKVAPLVDVISNDIPEVTLVNGDVTIDECPRRRLSRRDRHEQEMFSDVTKRNKEQKEDKRDFLKAVEDPATVPVEIESPIPYRRDKSIVYIDARYSFDSDTDSSISHLSTISSSGSDVTVILNDEQDITADDLRQLAQNSSDIGIEIGPLELDSSDDLIDSSHSTPDKPQVNPDDWSAALEDATQTAHVGKYATAPRSVSTWKTAIQEAGNQKIVNNEFGSKELPKEDNIFEAFKNDSKVRNNYLKFERRSANNVVYGTTGSMSSSNTSSVESSKGFGASSSKPEGAGKGFFSRLKSFRNSFREKFKNASKNAEKAERDSIDEIKTALGSHSLPIIDSNCNEMGVRTLPTFGKRAASNVDCSSGPLKPRTTYEAMRQHSGNLRKVVGTKSVSSEQLHSFRVNNRPKMSAKSMEVLLETCI